MALTRKFLKAMGIEDEKIDQIIEEHVAVTDALKKERDDALADAKTLPGIKKELEDLKAAGDGGYKEKYEQAQNTIEEYRKKEERSAKERAYRNILKEAGVREKYMETIIRADRSVIDSVIMADGKPDKQDELMESVKKNWADFIGTPGSATDVPENPPENNGGTSVTKDSIMAIKDPSARRMAIAQNLNLFGKGENK